MNLRAAPKRSLNENLENSPKIFGIKTSLFQIIIGGINAVSGFVSSLYLLAIIFATGYFLFLPLLFISVYYCFRGVSFILSASWAWYSICVDLVLFILLMLFFLLQGFWAAILFAIINGLLLWGCNLKRVRTNCGIRSVSKKTPQIILFIILSIIIQITIILIPFISME